MKAVIKLDVPDWQIGQEVSVYFPDTMIKRSICEPECKIDRETIRNYHQATKYIRDLELKTGDEKFSRYGDAMDAFFVATADMADGEKNNDDCSKTGRNN